MSEAKVTGFSTQNPTAPMCNRACAIFVANSIIRFWAGSTGFEPAISSVTGRRFKPAKLQAQILCGCGRGRTCDLGLMKASLCH